MVIVPKRRSSSAGSNDEKMSLVLLRAKMKDRHSPSARVRDAGASRGRVVTPEPRVGEAVKGITDGHGDERQPKEGPAGTRNIDRTDFLGKGRKKQGRRKVDKAGLAGEEQKDQPAADEDLAREYLQAMAQARQTEEFRKEENANDEPEIRDVVAAEETPADRVESPTPGGAEVEPKVPGLREVHLAGDAAPVRVRLGEPGGERLGEQAEDDGAVPTKPTATTPQPEQNPFLVKDPDREQPRRKDTRADLESWIAGIMARIDDLKSFDVAVVTQRFDPRIRELRDSVNNTLADIFGRNSSAYWHHSLPSLDAVPVVLGGPKPSPASLRTSYKARIDKAVKDLTEILEALQHRLNESISRASPPASR